MYCMKLYEMFHVVCFLCAVVNKSRANWDENCLNETDGWGLQRLAQAFCGPQADGSDSTHRWDFKGPDWISIVLKKWEKWMWLYEAHSVKDEKKMKHRN